MSVRAIAVVHRSSHGGATATARVSAGAQLDDHDAACGAHLTTLTAAARTVRRSSERPLAELASGVCD